MDDGVFETDERKGERSVREARIVRAQSNHEDHRGAIITSCSSIRASV